MYVISVELYWEKTCLYNYNSAELLAILLANIISGFNYGGIDM